MSMGLPVLVTNFSGITAFANDDNAYMIPILADLDEFAYARPDVHALSRLMREVVHDSKMPAATSKAVARAMEGRRTMQALSPEYCVRLMADRLRYHGRRRGWTF
jgi:hypothetical protein